MYALHIDRNTSVPKRQRTTGYFKQHFERSVEDKFNVEYLTSTVHVKHETFCQAKVTS